VYAIFTVSGSRITSGATVEAFTFSGGDKIAAITVGEPGRGRKVGVLPVLGDAPTEWYTLHSADVGESRSGRPLLKPRSGGDLDTSAAIVVLRTPIGFRGGNAHTGDRVGDGFHPFPGRVLVEGVIAQGAAGNMGSGMQIVAVMPRGVVWRTGYTGRLYGAPAAHYYVFDGVGVRVATWDERGMGETDPLEV
jgi:hypothetical protein